MRLRSSFALAAVGCLLTLASPAGARSETTSRYTLKQTYNAALRYLRVDLGFPLVEKDPEAAYLLFLYRPSPGKPESNGSLELVDSPRGVMVYVSLAKFPRSHEDLLSDGLLRKLKDEYGPPPEAPKPPPPKQKPGDPPKDGEGDDDRDDPNDDGKKDDESDEPARPPRERKE